MSDPTRFIRENVQSMRAYAPGEQINQATKLNTNECAWPASPRVFESLQGLHSNDLRQYPDPSSSRLRQLAADLYGCRLDNVLVGNGSDDCLTIIYRSICESGAKAVCPWPSYGLYDTLASIQNISIEHYDYDISISENGCQWVLPQAIANSDAQLCLIANPNNPSGHYESLSDLLHIIETFNGIVVIDEAYVDFASTDEQRKGLIPYINKYDNLIVLRTFSKSYSLAGARVGLLFSNSSIIQQFNKVKDSYNVNSMSQRCAEAAISDVEYHKTLIDQTQSSRQFLESKLSTFGWAWPNSEANFLLCYVGERASTIYHALKQQGILVRWWDSDELRNYLRITAGTEEENQALISSLESILAEMSI